MEIFCVVFALSMALFFYAATKKIYNPGTIFLGFWSVSLLLSALRLDNASEVGQEAYIYILLGLVFFALGAFVYYTLDKKPVLREEYRLEISDYRLMEIACVLVILYSLYRVALVVTFLSEGYSVWEVRVMHGIAGESGADTLKGGTVSQLLHDLIVAPCVYLIAPVFAVDIIAGKRNRRFAILAILAITLYSMGSISRSVWVFLILYLGIILLVFYKKQDLSPSVRKWIKRIPLFALAIFAVVLWITRSRSSDSEVNLLYNALAYLSGGIKLFDVHLGEKIADMRTYGAFSLYGFVYPVFFVLNYLGILPMPQAFTDVTYIKQQLETFVRISDHVSMNAYSTMFFNFYNDLGVPGVILGSFLFGLFCMMAYKAFLRYKNIRAFTCYLILIQFMLFSVARIYTIYTTRALSLVFLLLLLPKDEGKRISSVAL